MPDLWKQETQTNYYFCGHNNVFIIYLRKIYNQNITTESGNAFSSLSTLFDYDFLD